MASKWNQDYQDGYEAGYKRALEDLKTRLVVDKTAKNWINSPLEIFEIINKMKEL